MIVSDRAAPLPTADVCVVGAGPVGLALALRLEELGLSVLILESGPSGSRATSTEFLAGNHAHPRASTYRGIGGTSALWGGRCVPFDDLDFEEREHVPHSGWPIPHASLSTHYPAAAKFLQAGQGDLPSVTELAGEAFTLDAVERWSRTPVIAPVYEQRLTRSQSITVLTNASVIGVALGEDGRVDALRLDDGREVVTPHEVVFAAGGLEIARLLLGMQRDHPALFGGLEGPLGRFYQGHLTGYLAVAHLNDEQTIADMSLVVDANGYLYRRRLQPAPEHQKSERLLNIVFWLDAISISDPSHGSGSLSLLYLLAKASGTYRWLSRGLAPRSGPRRKGEFLRHLRNIRSQDASAARMIGMLRQIWKDGERGMLTNPSGRFLLRYHAEQAPNPVSRVQLKGEPGEALTLEVDYRVQDADILSVLHAHHLLDQWLRAKGYGKLDYLQPEEERFRSVLAQAFDGYHQIGLARMASDPKDGVVDTNCRIYRISNLYLAGACVFPTGGHANPTLPAVALALRLAEHLAEVRQKRVSREPDARPRGLAGA
ncbi:hypothetical protein ABID21_004589 [Pseudorhizobium tarimense]|uniref:Choline dehydrogenase n=1 Tax=Pseudorhizobium tarimense TaxID=1079109 RepID=A0ABV2HD31_9HYPH|nr:FAD-dependent oxidoreductase [Pseudorhizobium tarimense]MCJ8521471.1 GMC family oxidoreductase [Pseudorhizobium tarimense]